jgi:hypothetical protein
MRLRFTLLTMTALAVSCAALVPAPANAQTEEQRAASICQQLMPYSSSVLASKNAGTPKDVYAQRQTPREVLMTIPDSPEKVMSLRMLDVVEEVYGYDDLDPNAYAAYSVEICNRQLAGQPVPEHFRAAHPVLLSCNKLDESERQACGRSAAAP